MSPTIYGVGTGQFHNLSIQVPNLIRAALKSGEAEVIGEGKGIWDYVHIEDLADLYSLVLNKILKGEELPTGEMTIMFSATGRYSWLELLQRVATALMSLKAIPTETVKSMSLPEAADKLAGGKLLYTELGYASK
jgi:nucleoside-diphosphate-sugar epimerase